MAGHRPTVQRFRDGVDPVQEAEIWLEASRIAAQRGHPAAARCLLQAAIQARPDWAEARMFLAQLSKRQEAGGKRQEAGGRKIVSLLPYPLLLISVVLVLAVVVGGPVNRSLAWPIPTPTPVATPTPTPNPAQIVDQFVPRLQAALAGQNWERA